MANIEAGADQIDLRDVIERFEELEAEREELADAVTEAKEAFDDADDEDKESAQTTVEETETALTDWDGSDEFKQLGELLSELKGCGGDEQWRGDWYPIGLIEDSYFETAMDALIEDIGDLPKDLPSYLTVTIDYEALQQDYSSVEYGGFTYWYR